MERDIAINDYEFAKFVQCDVSASKLDMVPMIEAQELKEAIEDLAEWVLNNCDTSETVPLIFTSEEKAIKQVESLTGKKQSEWAFDNGDNDEDGRVVYYEEAIWGE